MYQRQSPRSRNHVTLPSARTHFMQNGAPPRPPLLVRVRFVDVTLFISVSVAFQTSKSKQQRDQVLQVKLFACAHRIKQARFSGGRTRWRAWNSCSCLARRPLLLFYQLLTQIQLPLVRFCFQSPNPRFTGALIYVWHFFLWTFANSRWSAGWMWSSWVSMWRSSVTATFLLLVILMMLMSNTNGIKSLLKRWGYLF